MNEILPSPNPLSKPNVSPQQPIIFSDIQTSLEHAEIKKEGVIGDTYTREALTFFDLPLSKIIDNTLNFFVNSFDNYNSRYSEAEMMVKDYRDNRGFLASLKIHLYAFVLFFKHESNIIYIGILLILISMVIYFVNISTS